MLGRGICEKYQSRDEKFPEPNGEGNLVSMNNTFCLSFSGPNMMYLFNSTERCYIKRTTDNVLQILLQASQ